MAYDIVIFGATGFTGQFVVEELAQVLAAPNAPKLTWAVAGRNEDKLKKVLGIAATITGIASVKETPIVIADVADQKSIDEMCKNARLILNCVGPYRFYGEQVVKACVEYGAHHIDISGEPYYLEKMQLVYHKEAEEKGIYVIGACGFDSIPCEMGLVFCQQQFEAIQGNGDFAYAESYLGFDAGPEGSAVNTGTWESAIYGFATADMTRSQRRKLLADKQVTKGKYRSRKPNFFRNDDMNGIWAVPFPGSDRSVVQRSQYFNYEHSKERYLNLSCYYTVANRWRVFLFAVFGLVFGVFASTKCGRALLKKYPEFFSAGLFKRTGPTREQIKGASFSMTFFGFGHKGEKLNDPQLQHNSPPDSKIRVKVSGPEPGYVTTPICMVAAALTVLEEKESIPLNGGVLTPGSAFKGTSLIGRLEQRGMKFDVEA